MTGSTKAVLVLVAIIAIVIPIALGAVLISGPLPLPTSTAAPPSSTSSSGTGTSGATVVLPSGIGENQQLNFSPPTLTVSSGTTVTFSSQDTATHNIDFTSVPSGSTVAQGTTSANLKDGDSYTVTLTTPGTYTYVCDYHTWMKGTITVTG